jgi:hypothetical protein
VWAGLNWLRIGSIGGLLWTRQRPFEFHNRRGVFWPVGWLSPSQKWYVSRSYLLTYFMVKDIIWKADSYSSCQKISCFLMESEGSLPCSQNPVIGPYPDQPKNQSKSEALWNIATIKKCLRWGLLAPRPTPKLEDHPLSAVRDCLFIIFAATFRNRRTSLYLQPEDVPCMTWWQRTHPTWFHGVSWVNINRYRTYCFIV